MSLRLLVVTWATASAAAAVGTRAPIPFVLAAAALALGAKILGDATEDVAVYLGPRAGGLFNALLGNSTVLIVACLALHAGWLELAKASVVGALLANLLLVLGVAAFLGGLRNGTQYFDRTQAGLAGTMMVLSVVALALPALYGRAVPVRNTGPVETLSASVAVVMLATYVLSLYYGLEWNSQEQAITGLHRRHPRRAAGASVATFALALAAVGHLAWVLVGAVRPTLATTGSSEFFLGIVVVALCASAQRFVAIDLAWRNRMDTATTIVLGSGLQLVLGVAPVLLFVSLLVGRPIDLIFSQIELAAVGAAVLVAALVGLDGESHWLEGAMLLAVYLLLAIAFFWWPTVPAVGIDPVTPTGHAVLSSVVLGLCQFG
jgi:Ca2+:H+ antiporter